MRLRFQQRIVLLFGIFLSLLFFVFSYTQIDLNLILSTNSVYLHIQDSLRVLANNRSLISIFYSVLILLFFIFYARIIAMQDKSKHFFWRYFLVLSVILLLSYPALSYDVFNYIFDARISLLYHLNPMIHTALEFPHDTWTRFMHNVQTPSPYGPAWTMLSAFPYVIGLGKFTLTLFSFKIFMGLGLACLFFIQKRLVRIHPTESLKVNLMLLFSNPLVLLETLSSGHNDVWTMVVVFLSVYVLFQFRQTRNMFQKIGAVMISFVLLLVAIEMKYVPVVLLPLWMVLSTSLLLPHAIPSKIKDFFWKYWADFSAIIFFLPLFSDQSKQFLPWYLLWSISFIPFVRTKYVKVLLLCFSFTSMFRYLPYLYTGGYTVASNEISVAITWSAVVIYGIWVFFTKFLRRSVTTSK